jgi:hypothetical protein
MKTTKQVEILIGQAKNGGNTFKSLEKSENLINDIHEYSKDNVHVLKSHASISVMMLLDEVNKMQRQIDNLKETLNIK